MLEKIFPATIDNRYSGNRISLWFFYLMTAITIARSLVHIFAPDGGAQSIATIPLDSYSAAAGATVIYMFSTWGLSQLLLGLVFLLTALRYKSLVPLMYLFIVIEYGGRLLLGHAKPIVTEATAPGAIGNYILVPLAVVLFVLSLRKRENSR